MDQAIVMDRDTVERILEEIDRRIKAVRDDLAEGNLSSAQKGRRDGAIDALAMMHCWIASQDQAKAVYGGQVTGLPDPGFPWGMATPDPQAAPPAAAPAQAEPTPPHLQDRPKVDQVFCLMDIAELGGLLGSIWAKDARSEQCRRKAVDLARTLMVKLVMADVVREMPQAIG